VVQDCGPSAVCVCVRMMNVERNHLSPRYLTWYFNFTFCRRSSWSPTHGHWSTLKVTGGKTFVFGWNWKSETGKTRYSNVEKKQTWIGNCKCVTPAAKWSVRPRVRVIVCIWCVEVRIAMTWWFCSSWHCSPVITRPSEYPNDSLLTSTSDICLRDNQNFDGIDW